MMLSDVGIWEAIRQGWVTIDPLPSKGQVGSPSQMQPASVDLRLSRWVLCFNPSPVAIDPFNASTYPTTRMVEIDDTFILSPREFVLGSTIERVVLDGRHAGRLEGKSSLGRLGVEIHSTAGFIDPGFAGHPTLEITNNMAAPVLLRPGMFVCQMGIFRLDQFCSQDYSATGKYHDQGEKPEPSRYWNNERP